MTSSINNKRKQRSSITSGNDGGTKNNWSAFLIDALKYIVYAVLWFFIGVNVLSAIRSPDDFTGEIPKKCSGSGMMSCSITDWFKSVWNGSWGGTKEDMSFLLEGLGGFTNDMEKTLGKFPVAGKSIVRGLESLLLLLGPILVVLSKFVGLFMGYFNTLESSWCNTSFMLKLPALFAAFWFIGPIFGVVQGFTLMFKLMFFIFTTNNMSKVIEVFRKYKSLMFMLMFIGIVLSIATNLKSIVLAITVGISLVLFILNIMFPMKRNVPE